MTVYWMPGDDYDDSPCGGGSVACTIDNNIYTSYLPTEHELVHAARSRSLPAPLEEGLATYWGDGALAVPSNGLLISRQELHELITEDRPVDFKEEYQRAAEFTAFLISEYGIAKLDELARRADYTYGFEQWRPTFEDTLDTSWEAVWQNYEASPECFGLPLYKDFFLCGEDVAALELTPQLGQDAVYAVTMDCSHSAAVGPDSTGRMMVEIPIVISDLEPGLTLWITLGGQGVVNGSALTLATCEPCSSKEEAVMLDSDHRVEGIGEFPAEQRLILQLVQPIEHPGELEVSIGY